MDSTTSRSDINAVKSRLGSISPRRLSSLPPAVQKLLTVDMPRLISELEALRDIASYHMASLCASGMAYLTCYCYGCSLLRKLDKARRG